jgi:hypothetical protein
LWGPIGSPPLCVVVVVVVVVVVASKIYREFIE